MRSITVKFTLAFLLVGLVGALLVAAITRQRIQSAFDQFVANRDQGTLAENLVEYYQSNGSWNGINDNLPALFNIPIPTAQASGQGNFNRVNVHFTLVDVDNKIIVGPGNKLGSTPSPQDMAGAIPLKLNNQIIGWLIYPPNPPDHAPNSPELSFLKDVNSASVVSALVAILLALILGGFLAFTMTRSLSDMTAATVELARGKLGAQVKVRSKDEIGKLAASFNKMSADLANATHTRRQMTADIAHDLRSPLSVLIGYTEALSDGKLPGTPEVYSVLYQETKHLSCLVDDLRTLSMADAGELNLNLQPVDPLLILDRAAASYAVTANSSQINIYVESSPDLLKILVDTERMAQVFNNLLTNALRYTPAGGKITLSAGINDGSVKLEVRDNGSGISPEDLPHIFDRFYRGDKSRHQSGESGLGLAIAKSIVEVHKGTITVESIPDQGSVFTIVLPAA